MKTKEKHWDDMYAKPLSDIPWEIAEPPKDLLEFISKSKLRKGSDVLDVACGSGNYSLYLAKKGYKVTGIDFSKKALMIAQERARELKLKVNFIFGNVLSLKDKIHKKFDFIFDYSLLHHIPFYQTKMYTSQFAKLLKPEGKLLVVCYSEKYSRAMGKRKLIGKYGNTMYFRTAKEIKNAYKDFEAVSIKNSRLGKRRQHFAYSFIFQKNRL